MPPSHSKRLLPPDGEEKISPTSSDPATAIMEGNNQQHTGEAEDLIRQLDSAFSNVHTFIVAGTQEANEARQNAKLASELARRFASTSTSSSKPSTSASGFFQFDNDMNNSLWTQQETPQVDDGEPNKEEEEDANGTRGARTAPPPPSRPPAPPAITPRNLNITPLMMNGDNKAGETTSSPLSTRSKRLQQNSATRMAQAQADDLLHVTLELEKVKQVYEREMMDHDETKAKLQSCQTQNIQLQSQMEKMTHNIETQREDLHHCNENYDYQIKQLRHETDVANQDAEMATNLAKQKHSEAKEMQELLELALTQVDYYRSQLCLNNDTDQETTALLAIGNNGNSKDDDDNDYLSPSPQQQQEKRRHVRFSDDVEAFPKDTPSRSLVAAGRQLLYQSLLGGGDGDDEAMMTTAAQRRDRLRRRLQQQLDEDDVSDGFGDNDDHFVWDNKSASGAGGAATSSSSPLSVKKSSSSSPLHRLGPSVQALEICRNTARILKASGRRLNLSSSRWFHNNPSNDDNNNVSVQDEMHLETLAKMYTSLVETVLERKHEQLQELESWCSIMEKNNSTTTNTNTTSSTSNDNDTNV